MMLVRKPSAQLVGTFLDEQRGLPISFPFVGATAGAPPRDYIVDHTRVLLGSGEQTLDSARRALKAWRQFDLGWVEALPRETLIREGETIAIVAHAMGLWWLNACRIVYVVDEPRRFGFAYATLPGHVEQGEERFLVELDSRDGSVWYDILAISRPRHPLTWLGYPIARRFQRRFARDSAAAMQRCVW
jgi:uncharacterized protein (UPF0548 family)